MAESGNWCLIESDPGVFTELISGMGVSGVQVEELWTLEDLDNFSPKDVYGLIFLFNLKNAPSIIDTSSTAPHSPDGLFFAKQVINNACATQAILSILLNQRENINLGPVLTEFHSFSRDFPSDMKGLAISNSETLRNVHNSFSRPEIFSVDTRKATKDDDLFHFISYVPFNGELFELDGLQESPIKHSSVSCSSSSGSSGIDTLDNHLNNNENWLLKVKPIIEKRMESYNCGVESEIRFNLLAVVKDPRQDLETCLCSLPSDTEPSLVAEISSRLQQENEKHEKMKKENARRRHNFIPLIVKLLELMAQKNIL